ncbi:MAG: DUF664 domain-containing protein [Knoellia sp.]
MSTTDAFTSLFDRMPDLVQSAVEGLSADDLARRPTRSGNTIAWLIWHLSRVEDDHVTNSATALGQDRMEQVWIRDGFAGRFALSLPLEDTGFGHSPEQVREVRVEGELLMHYYRAVHEQTQQFLAGLDDKAWETVVDTRWDPPVTLLARITSVANEVAQHVGQAAYVRGLLE